MMLLRGLGGGSCGLVGRGKVLGGRAADKLHVAVDVSSTVSPKGTQKRVATPAPAQKPRQDQGGNTIKQ